MPKQKQIKIPEHTSYAQLWESTYKPEILKYHEVPLSLVSTVLGSSINRVQEQLRSGLYPYGIARPCPGGKFSYEVYPLRLCAWVEGNLTTPQILRETGT